MLFYVQKISSGNFKLGEHYHLRENTAANNLSDYFLEIECFMFETDDLNSVVRYKKFIGEQPYNAYNSTAILKKGIFDSEQMRNSGDYKYKYTLRDFTDQNTTDLYRNFEINNLSIFDNELTPNSINYVYIFGDDIDINSNTKFVKETDLEITIDDINTIRCYTNNWDKIINPYFYNAAGYWNPGEIGEKVINNSNNGTLGDPNIVDLQPDNCRTVMVSGAFPTVIDRTILEEEIVNKIESYKNLFFNKGFMTKNNGGTTTVSFDGREYNTVYRGNSFNYHISNQTRTGVISNDFLLQNYSSTTIEKNAALIFINMYYNPNSTLYEMTFDEGIPYIAYDDIPYNSYYAQQEQEILFPPNCVITLLGPSSIEMLNGRPYTLQRVHLSWNIDIPILQEKNESVIEVFAEIKSIGTDYTSALTTLQNKIPQLQFNIFPT